MFFKKSKNIEKNYNSISSAKQDLTEYEKPVKDLVNGFYSIGTSISSFKLSIDFFRKSIFLESNNLDNIISHVFDDTNIARDKISSIFSDLEIDNSDKMKKISSLILNVQESLEGINKFLSATNMVSLNAKLEAARAKEYGKGFSIVADEIKRLSDQAKGVMNTILIREIESVSKELISKNLDDLKKDIDFFFIKMIEDIKSLQLIFKRFMSFQTEFEEMFSTLESIENNLVNYSNISGNLLESKLFMITNSEFLERINAASSAHITWVSKLKDLVNTRKLVAIQTDGTKCGFGLFYNSLVPKYPEIKQIWIDINEPHLSLHKTAINIIEIFSKDSIEESELALARTLLRDAEKYSSIVLKKLDQIKIIVLDLDSKKINVFDNN